MRYTYIIDKLFGKRSKVKALRFLVTYGREASVREVAREINISHPNTSAILKELEREGVLTSQRIGRSVIYSLNNGHYAVEKIIKPAFKAEEKVKTELVAGIKGKINFSFESIILFGSVLRGDEKPDSDIDLAFIIKDGEDVKRVEQSVAALNPIIIRKFGNTLSPVIMTKRAFVKKMKRNDALAREIARKGEVLAGKLISELL